jgi:purine catabolism regulator
MKIRLRPLSDRRSLDDLRPLRVADVLKLAPFAGSRALTADQGLDRPVTHVNVMQVPTDRFARPGDLVLATDQAFQRAPDGPGRLLASIAGRGVAAVAARPSGLHGVQDELEAVALESGLPLIELPAASHLSELLTGTLEALVASQAADLRRAAAVREQLGGFILGGGELDSLPDLVAELAQGEVAVIGPDSGVLAASDRLDRERAAAVAAAWFEHDDAGPAIGDGGWVVWPVLAGAATLGCLVARLPGPLDSVRLAALEYGASSAALELLNRREAVNADARLREGFVADLLSGSLEPDAMSRRVAVLGWEADGRYVVLLARGRTTEPATLTERATALSPATVAVQRRGTCLAITPLTGPDAGAARKLAEALAGTAPDVCVGVSSELPSVDGLAAGLREAEESLRVAEVFSAGGRVRFNPALGPLRLLADVAPEELRAFTDDALAPLDAAEGDGDGPLGATLRELLATSLNVAETARRGGWHYNTVRYRLGRLIELLGPFIEDGAQLQRLSLALLLRRELQAAGGNGAASGGAVQRLTALGLGDDTAAPDDPAARSLEP